MASNLLWAVLRRSLNIRSAEAPKSLSPCESFLASSALLRSREVDCSRSYSTYCTVTVQGSSMQNLDSSFYSRLGSWTRELLLHSTEPTLLAAARDPISDWKVSRYSVFWGCPAGSM